MFSFGAPEECRSFDWHTISVRHSHTESSVSIECSFTTGPVFYPFLRSQYRRHGWTRQVGSYQPSRDRTLKQTHGGFSGFGEKRLRKQSDLLVFRLEAFNQFQSRYWIGHLPPCDPTGNYVIDFHGPYLHLCRSGDTLTSSSNQAAERNLESQARHSLTVSTISR